MLQKFLEFMESFEELVLTIAKLGLVWPEFQ